MVRRHLLDGCEVRPGESPTDRVVDPTDLEQWFGASVCDTINSRLGSSIAGREIIALRLGHGEIIQSTGLGRVRPSEGFVRWGTPPTLGAPLCNGWIPCSLSQTAGRWSDLHADRQRDEASDACKLGGGDAGAGVAQHTRLRCCSDVVGERVAGLNSAVLGCRLDADRQVLDRQMRILRERHEDEV